jgi:hypothetical protein
VPRFMALAESKSQGLCRLKFAIKLCLWLY